MNFIVSLAKIPGGLFAAIFLKRFSTRPVFLASALLIAAAHLTMGLTNMAVLPSGFAMVAIATIQGRNSIDTWNFGHKAGHQTGPHSGPNSILGHYKFKHL